MGFKPRVGNAGSFEREFAKRHGQLVDVIGDEATVQDLLCHASRYDDPGLALTDRDRDLAEYAWGWFCGAADAKGKTRPELWTELTGRPPSSSGERRTPEPKHPLQPTFEDAWDYLVEAIGDDEFAEHLLVELPRDQRESAMPANDPERHDIEWAWGWFCGAADALGTTRRRLFRQLMR